MTGTVPPPRPRKGLRVTAWVFYALGAVLAVLAGLALLGGLETHDHDTAGLVVGVAFMVALAAGSALFGLHLYRESTRRPAYHRKARLAVAWACFLISALCALATVILLITWITTGNLSDPIGLVYPVSSALAFAQIGRMFLAASRRESPPGKAGDAGDDEEFLPATGRVLYREAFCNVNVTAALVALAVMGFGIWLISAIPGFSNPGPQGFLIMIVVLPGMWLLFVAVTVPYGIVLREGGLQLGVRGVPPAGRAWLRAVVPLEAVTQWDVVSHRDWKARKADYLSQWGKPMGAMPGLLMRHVLWVQADPQLVRERFPDVIMQSQYSFTDADGAGYVQNGIIFIGTRRPRHLTDALTSALPDKRRSRAAYHAL